MIDEPSERLTNSIVSQARVYGADLAGIARIRDLKESPSHRIAERMPEFEGVGTKSATGRRRGMVQWPEGARSAIVIAIAHPFDKPELDWWVTGASAGNTAGNRLLVGVVNRLADWLEKEKGIQSFILPYHIERGAVYMKDTAVMAGLGCIGKNNLLVTPQFGPRQRLRVMLIDADIPATEPIDFDPCLGCAMPCRKACPQKAFDHVVYSKEEYGLSLLPGRTGRYNRFECNRQMDTDVAGFEMIPVEGRDLMSKQVKYCRECERACPVGTD